MLKPKVYLWLIGVVSLSLTLIVLSAIDWELSDPIFAFLWLFGFWFLSFGTSLLLIVSIYSFFATQEEVKEIEVIKNYPRTAIIYPIRNETVGLLERMSYTLEGNLLPNLDFWILSDSDPQYLPFEKELFESLKKKHPGRVYYRNRPIPWERKQGNIKEWLARNYQYEYFYVCDADSMAPKAVIEKLLKKALYPDNSDIALFQTNIEITHAHTPYAEFQRIGAKIAQKLFFNTHQAIFRRQISFGHQCLIRRYTFDFIKIPQGILSHDIWDACYLDRLAFRCVFLPDVTTYDEAPSNYLEDRARAKRWAKGTLQSWPLLFKRGVSPALKFYVFHGIYLYISQPVFLFWLLLGLFAVIDNGQLLSFHAETFREFPFVTPKLAFVLFLTLGVVFGHKFVTIRRVKDFFDVIKENLYSLILSLNNLFYQTIDIISLPFDGLKWIPMNKNPLDQVSFKESVKQLWPTTVLGILGFLIFVGLDHYSFWLFFPILLSFTFSVPSVYFTGKPIPKGAL